MKKVQVIRETGDVLHEAEAAVEATLASAKLAVERLIRAKAELGLNGTVGDAAIAGFVDAVALLEEARTSMYEGLRDAQEVAKLLDLRSYASTMIPWEPRKAEANVA